MRATKKKDKKKPQQTNSQHTTAKLQRTLQFSSWPLILYLFCRECVTQEICNQLQNIISLIYFTSLGQAKESNFHLLALSGLSLLSQFKRNPPQKDTMALNYSCSLFVVWLRNGYTGSSTTYGKWRQNRTKLELDFPSWSKQKWTKSHWEL